MEYLQHLLEGSSTPFWSALILGLMTAISPCPMATNITAIGFLSKNIESRRSVFLGGILYTLGRAFSYTVLGVIFFMGASRFHVAGIFQGWGERVLSVFLILIGIFMLDIIPIRFPSFSKLTGKMGNKAHASLWSSFLLGLIFALAFCPYSGLLYFGVLIPMTITSPSGLYLPVVYALATGFPVLIIAWMLAYSLSKIGQFYNRMKIFEFWFRRIVAILFILMGFYYVFVLFIK